MNTNTICYNCFKEYSSDGACPYCGYDHTEAEKNFPHALKAGSILNGRYTVGRVLGQGGFGITYIAQDYQSHERVAIKEYFPSEFAGRDGSTSTVTVHSVNCQENFDYGKEQFLEEAKTLAAFIGNEHIVRIYSYFEENNTAYFAMEYVEGLALNKYMAEKGGRLTIEEANHLLLPLMDSLGKVHAKGIIHRDIAPDNIIITKDGIAKLIDFGAARYSTGEKSKSLDVILKHGFAPKEQYLRRGRQGPFTDVYALAATYYYTITGKVPPESIERIDEDSLIPPSSLGIKTPENVETTLFKALEVNSADRYQNMADFSRDLAGTDSISSIAEEGKLSEQAKKDNTSTEAVVMEGPSSANKPQQKQNQHSSTNKKKIIIGIAALAAVICVCIIFVLRNPAKSSLENDSTLTADKTDIIPQVESDSAGKNTTEDQQPSSSNENEKTGIQSTQKPTLNLQDIVQNSENNSSDFGYVSNGKEIQINSYNGTASEVVIPDEIDGLPVTKIGPYAFRDCDSIQSVQFPSHLVEIGDSAFAFLDNLKGVLILPETLEVVGSSAFLQTKLNGLVIQSSCKMGHSAFHNIYSLEFIYVTEGSNPDINKQGFGYSHKCTVALFPDSMNRINDEAFIGCSKLVIYTKPGSYAEEYAHKNLIQCDTELYDEILAEFERVYQQHETAGTTNTQTHIEDQDPVAATNNAIPIENSERDPSSQSTGETVININWDDYQAEMNNGKKEPELYREEGEQSEKPSYGMNEAALIETENGDYNLTFTAAEILPPQYGRQDTVYRLTWIIENIDYKSEYNKEGILISPSFNFTVIDSDGFIVNRMHTGWGDDMQNTNITVPPGVKSIGKQTYVINNIECTSLRVDLTGYELIVGQGATFILDIEDTR